MFSKKRLSLFAFILAGIILIAWSLPDRSATDGFQVGTPDIQSANALTFGPENVLFIGDSQGAAVFALDVRDEAAQHTAPVTIDNLDAKVAALLGTTKEDISINDIAVHPTSHNTYLSVTRGQGENSTPVVLRTTAGGDLEAVSLENVRFSKGAITNAPAPDAMMRRRPARPYTITDMAFVDGQVYVAGLTNEEFASHFRRLAYPFTDAMTSTSLEIYHVNHQANETHAPVNVFTPLDLDGTLHMAATYTCTPLVTFAVDGLTDGTHVKGKTVAELGGGNRALGMVTYEKDGNEYLLISNSRHPLMRIDTKDVATAKRLEMPTEDHGVSYTALDPQGIQQLATFNADYVVALQQSDEALHLVSLSTASL